MMNNDHQLSFLKAHPSLWTKITTTAIYGYLVQNQQQQTSFTHPTLLAHLALNLEAFQEEKISFKVAKLTGDTHQFQPVRVDVIMNQQAIASKTGIGISVTKAEEKAVFILFPDEKINFMNADSHLLPLGVEERLRISEQAFQESFDNSAIGMAIISLHGRWKKINKRISAILGYSEEELSVLRFHDITHPDDLESDLALVKQLLDGEINYYQLEKRYFHKKGTIVYAVLAVSLVRDKTGKPLHFVSQIIDISSIKKAERRIKKLLKRSEDQNHRLENFAHIVSHNLRSHAGNFAMLLELYRSQLSEEDEIINLLNEASESLQETIKHLSEIVTIHKTIINTLEPHSLRPVVDKVIQDFAPIIAQEEIEVSVHIDDSLCVMVVMAYLESIVLNFISNAIKYADPAKDRCLEIVATEQKKYVKIDFIDNGLGIDLAKHKENLFKMYKTFHYHEDARGIGLFITKSQIDAMGGKVEVTSVEGEGSKFSVFLKKYTHE